jgi:hypothetical protein
VDAFALRIAELDLEHRDRVELQDDAFLALAGREGGDVEDLP